jgi:hypothetical protein
MELCRAGKQMTVKTIVDRGELPCRGTEHLGLCVCVCVCVCVCEAIWEGGSPGRKDHLGRSMT